MTELSIFEPSAPEGPAVSAVQDANAQAVGRDLFRYLVTPEWADSRAIMGVFADTFFSEFTPDDVAARLADAGHMLDTAIVGERLDSLRRWGCAIQRLLCHSIDVFSSLHRSGRTPAGQTVFKSAPKSDYLSGRTFSRSTTFATVGSRAFALRA